MHRVNNHSRISEHQTIKKPFRVRSEPPQLSHVNSIYSNIGEEIQQQANRISLPITSPFQANSCSIFKPKVQCWLPQRTNVKYLNDFLKKQAIIFRHKQRVLVRLEKKNQQNQLIQQLQGKIVKMLKLQTKAELLNASVEPTPRNDKQIISLPTPNAEALVIRHKTPQYKRQSLVSKGGSVDQRNIKKPKKEILPLLQLYNNEHPSPAILRKSMKKDTRDLPPSRISLTNSPIHEATLSLKVSSLKCMKPRFSAQLEQSTPSNRA